MSEDSGAVHVAVCSAARIVLGSSVDGLPAARAALETHAKGSAGCVHQTARCPAARRARPVAGRGAEPSARCQVECYFLLQSAKILSLARIASVRRTGSDSLGLGWRGSPAAELLRLSLCALCCWLYWRCTAQRGDAPSSASAAYRAANLDDRSVHAHWARALHCRGVYDFNRKIRPIRFLPPRFAEAKLVAVGTKFGA